MKILFTTGGSGGHFYPIIAVAEKINQLIKDERLLPADLYFMSDSPYDKKALQENNIEYIQNSAGKLRRYFSWLNFADVIKMGWGIFTSLFKVFSLYPDVVFSKGAYASLPTVIAARLLGIPIIIHESDSIPGRTNLFAGKFATKIAVSYPEAAQYFKADNKVAVTGNPVREVITKPNAVGAVEYLKLFPNLPTILILGGSLGSQIINDTIIEALPDLVSKYQIIHQTGKENITGVANLANMILKENENKGRYHVVDYLNELGLTMAASVANVIISRAGSTIFEIANWGIPSIIIPITDSNGDHQRRNAYTYARSGACTVLEEDNLSSVVLISEIDRILENPDIAKKMSASAKEFARPDAATKIAREILNIALSHEN